jgi:hypothetical protein
MGHSKGSTHLMISKLQTGGHSLLAFNAVERLLVISSPQQETENILSIIPAFYCSIILAFFPMLIPQSTD